VRDEIQDLVRARFDLEIEALIVGDAPLPPVFGLVVLLGVQARVTKIAG
jgi:hypothetical protein